MVLAQNVWVELFLYHGQLAAEHRMSWAPLAPTGPWWNPTLIEVAGRPVRLQTQLPWILMTPIFYALSIWCYRRFEGESR